eukprot:Protomagalhaensia_sp_Gyna_25__5445@NODE_712_length_2795_cov_40_927068_g554_i0_p1_GENE_NODE_712_length_2795_cov_40_927068_g554_i0NODE_712_length_2795_cov_40_927068_g554_i0_p1_ORF_typecomplete_len408_score74_98Bystin/PF05291_11/2_7e80_NODE_712_length_2795_cov_40_927068_g554_i0361259
MVQKRSYAAITKGVRQPAPAKGTDVKKKGKPYNDNDSEDDSGDEAFIARDEKFAASVQRLIEDEEEQRLFEERKAGTGDGQEQSQDDDNEAFEGEDEDLAPGGIKLDLFGLGEEQQRLFDPPQYKTIGDILFEQMETQKRRDAEKERMELFTETTRTAYSNLGKFMARFRSGKLPQLLKCIPSLKNWLDILWLTNPENWTFHAIKEATPIFVHGLRSKEVARYLQYVVLPAVLKSIDKTQKLNVQLFETLKKSIYKAQEWIKGIYFPIILDDACTYRRAAIINAVLAKCSITPITSGALLVKLALLPSHNNVIIYSMVRIINKKHNLPLNVINVMVDFFRRWLEIDEEPTVIWHQLMLVFVQRWKDDLNQLQKEALKIVMRRHPHPKVSAEVRRELFPMPSSAMSMC